MKSRDKEIIERMDRARLAGLHRGSTAKEFEKYLLQLGLHQYETVTYPLEMYEDYPYAKKPEASTAHEENIIRPHPLVWEYGARV